VNIANYKIYNNCINEITVEKQNEKSLAVHLKTPAAHQWAADHRLRNTGLDSLKYYYQNYSQKFTFFFQN